MLDHQIDLLQVLRFVKEYYKVPQLWHSGDIYFTIIKLSTRWIPGNINILAALSSPGTSRVFRQSPDRGLADMLQYWVIDLMNSNYRSSVELMLSLSLVLGGTAFWELAPQFILEVDPAAILNPDKILLIKKTLIHRICDAQNAGFVCMCTDNGIHTSIAEQFEGSVVGTEDSRAKARAGALAMMITSLIIGVTLNAVSTSHLIGI